MSLPRRPRLPGELWRRRRNGALAQFVSSPLEGSYVFDNLTEPQLRRTLETSAELAEGEFAADYLADSLADAFSRGLILAPLPDGPQGQQEALLALAEAAARVYALHGRGSEAHEWSELAAALTAALPFALGEGAAQAPRPGSERVVDMARGVAEALRPALDAFVTTKPTGEVGRRRSVDPEVVADVLRTVSSLLKSRK